MDQQTAEVQTTRSWPKAVEGTVFARAEDVLLLAVAMPGMPMSQRRAVVAFAVEDRIAQPLESVLVTLGPELSAPGDERRWLVAVASPSAMPADAGRRRVIPDVLLLPVPAAGTWSVWIGAERALVRTPDGAGFGCPSAALAAFHRAGDSPSVVLFGGDLPEGFDVQRRADLPARLDPAFATFDLNGGATANAQNGLPAGLMRFAMVGLFGLFAHTALLTADVLAYGNLRDDRAQSVRAALGASGQPVTGDLAAALSAVLAREGRPEAVQLLPFMSRVFAGMDGAAGRMSLRDLRYDAATASLAFIIEAPDLTTLQSIETSLSDLGFAVAAGTATTGNGLAEQRLTITEGAS